MFKKSMVVINLLGSLSVFTVMCISKGLHKSKKMQREPSVGNRSVRQ
ncbi:hypothetical protein Metal_3457 [Methylomicrobium album BG8]|uniref:Lipoprotein n=1 Tax=Methylomicrobium album BG8 TaxID=686340 RepID=H8GRC7_METAL|nr:hypothetical protein Metal_3457 [Methylomicrobium album BG8]